ncbi:hypothetical protein [Sutcliffiella halmapala]|uniref:hypothetical protein n=1 Tax=Sutcliffiella halmapala TaxID=79882 RepID=UPI0009953FEE|nr:hypothetical protein [Sutcliffiella halmapala]
MNKELIIDNVEFLNNYIPKLMNAIDEVVGYLITNNETQSLKILQSLMEGLDWTIRSISSLRELGYVENLNIDEMNQFLIETEQAFRRKDYVLLGDLLQYEIARILDNWLKKIESIDGDLI